MPSILPRPAAGCDRGHVLAIPGATRRAGLPETANTSSGTGTIVAMDSEVITVRTGSARTVVDLTDRAADFVRGRGDGLLHVFVPHATAGLAVIETGAGSDDDLLAALDRLLPADDRWRHRHGSAGHGRDHVLPAVLPPYATLPVLAGRLALGTWQSLCLVDTNVDNPTRQVRLSFLTG
jgi:secondary thiamine-phosphate synthase enzyme